MLADVLCAWTTLNHVLRVRMADLAAAVGAVVEASAEVVAVVAAAEADSTGAVVVVAEVSLEIFDTR